MVSAVIENPCAVATDAAELTGRERFMKLTDIETLIQFRDDFLALRNFCGGLAEVSPFSDDTILEIGIGPLPGYFAVLQRSIK